MAIWRGSGSSARVSAACRFAVAAGVLNGCIIAVGGFNGSQYLATVERYDPREGCWEVVSP